MRRTILFVTSVLAFLTSILAGRAEDYKILYITSPDISIGGKYVNVGDVFSDSAPINWTGPRQAIKVQHISTHKQSLIVAEKYKKFKSSNLMSYLASNKQLSARQGELLNPLELSVVLNRTHYLLDTISVNCGMPVDDTCFFYATYEYNGETINKKLTTCRGKLIFDQSLFSIDGIAITPFDVDLKVYYINRKNNTKTIIADKMKILPLF